MGHQSTEQPFSAAALRALETVLEHSPTPMALISLEKSQTRWSRSALERFGLTLSEKGEASLPSIVDKNDWPMLERMLIRSKELGVAVTNCFHCNDGSGAQLLVDIKVVPVESTPENNELLLFFDFDRSLEELQRTRELFFKTFVSQRDAILIMDASPERSIIDCNPAALEMFGYGLAEFIGSKAALLHVSAASVSHFERGLYRAIDQEGHYLRDDYIMRRKDGSTFPSEHTVVPLMDGRNERIGWVSVVRDISERRAAEKEAERRQLQLQRADTLISLGILTSGIAHEVNNPNQFIMTHISALQKTWQSARPILDRYAEEHGDFLLAGIPYSKRRSQIDAMHQNALQGAQRIKAIVQQVRDHSRELPRNDRHAVNVNQIVAAAVSLLEHTINRSTGSFSMRCAADLPQVRGSRQRLEQVCINLLQNACQALDSDDGALEISTKFDEPNQSISIIVKDEGVGIPEENLEQIKAPFFTTKGDRGGTGLGLYISTKIAEEHDGSLHFDSKPGAGTTVTLSLPTIE